MAFVELKPTRKPGGTGVRLSLTESRGLILSLKGAALEALGNPPPDTPVRAALDIGILVLRVSRDPAGPFRLSRPTRFSPDSPTLVLRIGRVPLLPDAQIKGADCTWETSVGGAVVDVDLPRELRAVEHAGKGVSLPKVSSVQRESA